MLNLITLERAKINLPQATTTDDKAIENLIDACSRSIQKYCQRDFAPTAYDELYNGVGQDRLLLRNYPLLSVDSVRCHPATVLEVQNTDTSTNQQARVKVADAGLSLVRVASGTRTTNDLAFASNSTLSALASSIVALGNGWTARSISGFENFPSLDLKFPQGAYNCLGQYAGLKIHTEELVDFDIDPENGWLLKKALGGSFDDPSQPLDLWGGGVNYYRIQYSAGYHPIPEGIQEACAEWVAELFFQLARDPGLQSEAIPGAVSRQVKFNRPGHPPRNVCLLLAPYRRLNIHNHQG